MLKIAVAGLGTVGVGTINLLQKNADLITARAGQPIAIRAVSARDKNRKRDCDLSGITWVDDPRQLASLPDIDVVVEVIGGAEGVVRELAEAALKNGKHYVTANKALLAAHGASLARLAEANGVGLHYEAAVAGGIPIIKALREGLAGNRITSVRGIINGTCNYILTRMQDGNLAFDDVLKEAQDKGFAEADPSYDIDGHDAAHKLALLTALAFGVEPSPQDIVIEGIRALTSLDMMCADELGYRIKLLGVTRRTEHGIQQYVAPSLVTKGSMLANVRYAMNAVMIDGDAVGGLTLIGAGAGALPTGSAVVADLVDIARGIRAPTFGLAAAALSVPVRSTQEDMTRFYIRLDAVNHSGVVATIGAALADEGISIASLVQRKKWERPDAMPIIITTEAVCPINLRRAMGIVAARPDVMLGKPCIMRIEG